MSLGVHFALSAADCKKLRDEDFEYTWSSVQGLPAFFARAAAAKRAVLFSVDG